MTKDKNKTISKKLKRTIAIIIIVIVAVSSFQLYEKVSEPKNQIYLNKNIVEVRQCVIHSYQEPELYYINGSAFNAKLCLEAGEGLGGVSKFGDHDWLDEYGLITMNTFMVSCNIRNPYSSLSFEITNVVGKIVNETYGNATSIHYCVCSHCWHISNSTYHILDQKVHLVTFGSGFLSYRNHRIKYPGVGEYANFNLTHEVNYTLYYAVTLVPILHYNYLLSGYVTGKPITLVYNPNVIYFSLLP